MFSTKLTRVATHRTTSTAAFSSQTTAGARGTHQRRPSSSKASCPPDSSKPGPAAKASTTAEPAQPAQPAAPKKRSTKYKRFHSSLSERLAKKHETVDHFAGLPAVPGVQHLQQSHFGLSSFFSLHRPLSLSTTVPPPSSEEVFNSIFESRPQRDKWENGNSAERRPEDVIYTLHNTIESLEAGASDGQEDAVRWEVIQEQSNGEGTKHLDGVPAKMRSLDELVAQFKPFSAPPPPEPFPGEGKAASGDKKQRKARQSSRQKSYTITIGVTESTTADGERTFTASPRSIFELPEATDEKAVRDPTPSHMVRQPFLKRMRRRQQHFAEEQSSRSLERMGEPHGGARVRRAPGAKRMEKMQLISVKRQRKLKMKKHKYKKLMKRTRNLRRRLDRA